MALTRDEILAKRSVRQRVAVEVPELGTVYVAKFTARDRDRFEEIITGGIPGRVNLRNVRAQVVPLLVVDENGKRLFEDSDSDAIGELDSDTIQAIVDAGFKINGINQDVVEEEVKN